MDDQPAEAPGRIRDIRVYRPSFVGMALLVCTPFLVLGAASVYGGLAATMLLVVWLLLFALGCRWFMRRPWRVLGVALLSLLCWLVVVLAAS